MFSKLHALWLKIPLNIRKEVVSNLMTFGSLFVAAAIAEYKLNVNVPFTWELAFTILVSAIRTSGKTVINALFAKYFAKTA